MDLVQLVFDMSILDLICGLLLIFFSFKLTLNVATMIVDVILYCIEQYKR